MDQTVQAISRCATHGSSGVYALTPLLLISYPASGDALPSARTQARQAAELHKTPSLLYLAPAQLELDNLIVGGKPGYFCP